MPLENFVVLDLETTGVQPGLDEIIEIGAVKVVNGELTDRFQTLVRPQGKLPIEIQRLTGIRDEDLKDQPPIQDVLPAFIEFSGGLPVAAHNAGFDLGFLGAAMGRPFAEWSLDTVALARIVFPLAPSYKLSTLAHYLGLEAGGFHRAVNDAEVAARLLLRCLAKIAQWDWQLVRQINLLLESDNDGVARLLREQERELARRFPNRLIRDNLLCLAQADVDSGLFSRGPEQKKTNRSVPELEEIAAILGPSGPLTSQIPNYQHRPGQLAMLAGVVKAFTANRHLVVEAGTGTGKSLAYLVPAVCWATAQQEKVVIATHTINLQEQLWEKDLPLLRKLLPIEFEAALVKGRSNYLCLRKWVNLEPELGRMSSQEKRELAAVVSWLSETVTGDRTEINLGSSGKELWYRFAADSESCLGSRCRFYNGRCFVMRARRNAERADILIVNHSLLLSDAKADHMVLPDYNYLVIDEAHHLEDSATEHLGSDISNARLEHFLRLLRQNGNPPGLLGMIKHRQGQFTGKLNEAGVERLEKLTQESNGLLGSIQNAADEFFAGLEAMAHSLGGSDSGLIQARIKESAVFWYGWQPLKAAQENLSLRLESLSQCLKTIGQILAEPEDEDLAGLVRDVNSLALQSKELADTAANLLDMEVENTVVWVEVDQRTCRLRSAPVDVGPLLRELVFAKVKAAILTSATLSVNNSFENFLETVGLAADTDCLQVESPFRYEEQSLICVPRDVPDPTRVSEQEYVQAVSQLLIDVVRTVQGRTLVLFTSHKMLRETYFQVKPCLEMENITVLGHSLDGSRGRLVEEFKANPRAVLLGASSFWEGVDIQGDALSCVVIVRLPFFPPTIPTVEARLEEMARKNKDGFRSFSIPQAVIRLKQGFGRLIRTQEDRGVVVILDNRILDKSYGRKFLNSLPLKTHIRGDSELVLRKIKSWLQGGEEVPLRQIENSFPYCRKSDKILKGMDAAVFDGGYAGNE